MTAAAIRTPRQRAGMVGAGSERERDDFYPTPPELTQALLSVEQFDGPIWEPACGDGALSRELETAGHTVISTDLVDRGYGTPRRDFLMETRAPDGVRNIITNPPFKLGEQFWAHSCQLVGNKVAFLCRLTWLEGMERSAMFARFPLARVWIFPWRPKFQRGRLATERDPAGMLAHAWFVRDPAHTGPTQLHWLRRAA